jgi:dUTP pyrophosphatase
MLTMYPTVNYVMLDSNAKAPRPAKEGDAGMDLVATEDALLYAGETKLVHTGIAIELPKGFAGLVMPRSGLALKGITLSNCVGLIDSGYRGEIGVELHNNNPSRTVERTKDGIVVRDNLTPFPIHKGDRIAQLVIIAVATATMCQVSELGTSQRGTGGFGSTGVRERP